MGDVWSGETDYDRNQGERDKRDAQREKDAVAAANQNMNNALQNPGQSFSLYGNSDTINSTAANLSQVGAMTGQGIFQTGQQNQDYLKSLEARRSEDSAGAKYMIGQKNRNMANVGRQFAGKKVAGGVAAAGMNSAAEQGDASAAKELQSFDRTADQDLYNYVKRQQKLNGEALAMGADQGLAQGMDTSQAEGAFGTVICTELHRQGIMDNETYRKDAAFGENLLRTDPHAVLGYRMMATPIAKLMKKSKFATRIISIPALAWAGQMAGRENFAGKVIMLTGIPFCRFVYRLTTGYYFCSEVREYV